MNLRRIQPKTKINSKNNQKRSIVNPYSRQRHIQIPNFKNQNVETQFHNNEDSLLIHRINYGQVIARKKYRNRYRNKRLFDNFLPDTVFDPLTFRGREETEEQIHRIDEMSDEAFSIIERIHNTLNRADDEYLYGREIKESEVPKSRQIIRKIKESEVQNSGECAICLCEFEKECDISELPCGHIFHPECISSWINKHPTCPICRKDTT